MQSQLILLLGASLMVVALISARAKRTLLSASVVALVAGLCFGRAGFGWVDLTAQDAIIQHLAELSLFAILFVDGAQLSLNDLRHAWRLPGRALLVGMPITIGVIAAAAHFILGLAWPESLLVGAILSPTDPVFVAAMLDRQSVPQRLRRLLSVESGLNDGLALPMFVVMLEVVGHEKTHPMLVIADAAFGIVAGVVVPLVFSWLERRRIFATSESYRPIAAFGIAAFLFGLAQVLPVNQFLAAFAAGATIASVRPDFARALHTVGRPMAEILKVVTLVIFGVMLTPALLAATGWPGLLFAAVTLLAARPIALVLAFIGSQLSRKEWLAAAWFGPRGFASLLYALLMLHSGVGRAEWLFSALSLVIVLSMIAHSSSDVAVARAFKRDEQQSGGAGSEPA